MPPDRSSFECVNLPPNFELPARMDYFTLSASPNTQLWRKPPADDTTTAPLIYTGLRNQFVVAEVTVTALAEYEWDQAGLVIFTGSPPTERSMAAARRRRRSSHTPHARSGTTIIDNNNDDDEDDEDSDDLTTPRLHRIPVTPRHTRNSRFAPQIPTTKWVKAGLELNNGRIHATSVCASSHGADWSLTPLGSSDPDSSTSSFSSSSNPGSASQYPSSRAYGDGAHGEKTSLRIKFERVGHSLFVWYQIPTDAAPTASSSSTFFPAYNHFGFGGGGHSLHPPPPPPPGFLNPTYLAGSWRKLREVSGFFWGVEDKCVYVGVYASRPVRYVEGGGGGGGVGGMLDEGDDGEDEEGGRRESRDGLVVEFEDLESY